MILVLDSSALTLLINPSANPPKDPETHRPLSFAKQRIEGLLESLTGLDILLVPTPVLAEVLVIAADGAPGVLEKLQTLARVRISPFDQRAAIETAMMEKEARELGNKKGASEQPWQKVKFDRQIIAISRVAGADEIFSDDKKLSAFARSVGMVVRSTWDLPVPESTPDLFSRIEPTSSED